MERKENASRFVILKKITVFAMAFIAVMLLNTHIAKAGTMYQVVVEKGYLALRNDKAYDSRNEIGKLYTGDTVEVTTMGKISIYLASKPFYYSSHSETLLSYKERA